MTRKFDFREDNAIFTFGSDEHDDLRELITQVDRDTVWGEVHATDVVFRNLKMMDPTMLSQGDDTVFTNSVEGELPIAVYLKEDGRTLATRPYLLKNFKEHCGDKAKVLRAILSAGAYDVFCQHLNLGIPYLSEKKKVLYMVRGDKVSGWFSEYNAAWSEGRQLDYVEASFEEAFPSYRFSGGEWSHYFLQSNYVLAPTIMSPDFGTMLGNPITKSYLAAWEAAGGARGDLENAVPCARFMTGESGLQSISLSATLRLPDGRYFVLGAPLSVNHRGEDKNVWGKFEHFPEDICSLYRKGMKGIEELCKRKIFHPYACLTKCLDPFRPTVGVEYLREAVESTKAFYPPEDKSLTCSALEIYTIISTMVAAATASASPIRRVQNEELLARLIGANWDSLDVATPVKLYGKFDLDSYDD